MATPRNISEYCVVAESDTKIMGKSVTEKIKKGFRPWGQLVVIGEFMLQPMTKHVVKEKKKPGTPVSP